MSSTFRHIFWRRNKKALYYVYASNGLVQRKCTCLWTVSKLSYLRFALQAVESMSVPSLGRKWSLHFAINVNESMVCFNEESVGYGQYHSQIPNSHREFGIWQGYQQQLGKAPYLESRRIYAIRFGFDVALEMHYMYSSFVLFNCDISVSHIDINKPVGCCIGMPVHK